MSISPTSEAKELQRSIYLKFYYVQKWEIIFIVGLNAAKNMHYIKKASNKSCSELNFVQKSPGHICLSPPGVELGGFSISVH